MSKRFSALTLVGVSLLLVACNDQQAAMNAAAYKASSRAAYVQKNDVEFANYDRRQRLSDDPNTIVWCTSAFPIPSSPLFTIPIAGKLTSGGKRPFPTDPGPDGMYGSSGEYRYGFTTGGVMADFYNLSTFCTTEPTVWQRQKTELVMDVDGALREAQKQASEALRHNNPAAATRILSEAIAKTR